MNHNTRIKILRTVAANDEISHVDFMRLSDMLFPGAKTTLEHLGEQVWAEMGGNYLESIKRFRALSGAGLKEAVDIIRPLRDRKVK